MSNVEHDPVIERFMALLEAKLAASRLMHLELYRIALERIAKRLQENTEVNE